MTNNALNFTNDITGSYDFNAQAFFLKENNLNYPSSYCMSGYFMVEELIEHLTKISVSHHVFHKKTFTTKQKMLKEGYFNICPGLSVAYMNDHGNNRYISEEDEIAPLQTGEVKATFNIFYSYVGQDPKGIKLIDKHLKDLSLEIESKEVEQQKKSQLNIITNTHGELDLTPFTITKPSIDLALSYGKEFLDKHEHIVDRLSMEKNAKGLVLLHGTPGTGKTTYIRYLLNLISDKKKVIYVPPDMAEEISSPKFLPFLMEHPNSILVIEDSENIIKQRSSGQNQAVANLLNTTDGLLSDVLKIQILCTFNCNITDVDKALKRKGRLIAEHEFAALSVEDAGILAKSLGLEIEVKGEMTLADIYNHLEPEYVAKKNKLGFAI